MSHKSNSNNPFEITDKPFKSGGMYDIYQPEGLNYPIMERTMNAFFWPEAPKGRLDLEQTYEVSSVPEDPGTPLESVGKLENKGVMPD